jgi:hypothetical protein
MNLVPLIPAPLPIKTCAVAGTLHIEGDMTRNIVRFRFQFSRPFEVSPVLLVIQAGGKKHRYYCTIRDETGAVMETPAFHPEFCVGRRFTITAVEPVAWFIQSKNLA